ncbi:hypothetical protein PanWU01x14_008770 [Parasponia andersonii]|uniref:Uncharacterized protein n=1 Tax=Parasponia andersonii TaxID=3476 RepID=A0A2P5E280_PARAD|nr:hypothetical protein PanWU01x14_008770 [Parasponia andersonii]
MLVRKNTKPFHKSWVKIFAEQKAKIELSIKKYFHYKDVSTTQDIYKYWKNELNEHFKFNGGDKNNLDLLHARRSVPLDMTQEVWNNFLTQSIPPRIDEILIASEMLSIRRGYRRRVGLKLKRVASTSSTIASPPWDPPMSDSEL